MNRIIKITGLLLIIINITSCSTNTVYEEYNKLERMNWQRFNNQVFEFVIEDIEKEYDIYLLVRHIPEIPYKTWLINYTLYTPSGDMRSNDLSLELYDHEGNKLSQCLGDLCDFKFLIRQGLKITEPGVVKFEIENKYSKVDMPGIIEVGLLVKESD